MTLVKAALTMNLTIIETQGQYAVHGRLNEIQRGQIRRHPEQAAQRLRAAGVVDEAWLRTVAEHHERADGGGYSSGLPEPTEDASVLRMIDVFMAKISPRCGGQKVTIQDATRQMFGEHEAVRLPQRTSRNTASIRRGTSFNWRLANLPW